MKAYIVTCITVAVISAFAAGMSHKEYKGVTRSALGVLLLLTMLSPLAALGQSLMGSLPNIPTYDGEAGEGEYSKVAEAAFEKGIAAALTEEYYLSEGSVFVACEGFLFEEMRAERIHITLSGAALAADYRSMREFTEKNFLLNGGRCEVDFEIGKDK